VVDTLGHLLALQVTAAPQGPEPGHDIGCPMEEPFLCTRGLPSSMGVLMK
jgi:hypothetical protein